MMKIIFLVLFGIITTTNVYGSSDSEMEKCISTISELMPSFDVNTESGKIAYTKLCESAYDNYGKYFQDMDTAELNDASEKLLQYMEYIFGK